LERYNVHKTLAIQEEWRFLEDFTGTLAKGEGWVDKDTEQGKKVSQRSTSVD
jgi:hypothetical protein